MTTRTVDPRHVAGPLGCLKELEAPVRQPSLLCIRHQVSTLRFLARTESGVSRQVISHPDEPLSLASTFDNGFDGQFVVPTLTPYTADMMGWVPMNQTVLAF